MNNSELAFKILEYESKLRELKALENEIRVAVLQRGKSQTVGNVRVTYSKGRRTYFYEQAVSEALENADQPRSLELQALCQKHTTPKVDWRQVCLDAGIKEILCERGDPGVSFRLLED